MHDLSITATGTPNPVTVGQNLTYTLTITNHGPDTAVDVTVTDLLPTTVVPEIATPGCFLTSATVQCALGSLDSGANATVTVGVVPQTQGQVRNVADVSAGTLPGTFAEDPNLANNEAEVLTTVLPPPFPSVSGDLSLNLTGTPTVLTVNGQLTYTINVTNNGPAMATGVHVLGSLPPEAVLAGPSSSSQGECRDTGAAVCNLGTLAPGAQATVTMNVIPIVAGDLMNDAVVAALEVDPNLTNTAVPR